MRERFRERVNNCYKWVYGFSDVRQLNVLAVQHAGDDSYSWIMVVLKLTPIHNASILAAFALFFVMLTLPHSSDASGVSVPDRSHRTRAQQRLPPTHTMTRALGSGARFTRIAELRLMFACYRRLSISTLTNFHQFYLPTRSDFSMTPQVSRLLPPSYQKPQLLVSAWLEEDTPFFDYGGVVVSEAPHDSFLIDQGWEHAVLGGTPLVDEVFCILDCK